MSACYETYNAVKGRHGPREPKEAAGRSVHSGKCKDDGKERPVVQRLVPFGRYNERHSGVAHDRGKDRDCARADDHENKEHTVTAVFVGGSRRITRLPVEAKTRINNVADRGFAILIGDANGADKAVQKHLAEAKYDKVTVYCSGETSRNNIGQWEIRNIRAGEREKTFQFYAAKDREMAQQAKFGLMIWDGKSPGTALNILRLVQASKKAVLVSVAEKSEVEFKSKEDWDAFLSRCSSKLRRDMERRAIQNELFMLRPEQDEFYFGETDEPIDGAIGWSELK